MDSKETQTYFKEHNIPSLDVDWFISSKKISKKSIPNKINAYVNTTTNTDISSTNDSQQSLHRRNTNPDLSVSPTSSTSNHMSNNSSQRQQSSNASNTANGSPLFKTKYLENKDQNNIRKVDHTDNDSFNVPLRRTKSLSAASSSQSKIQPLQEPIQQQQHEKKMGFFKSLFSRRKSTSSTSSSTTTTATTTTNNNNNSGTVSSSSKINSISVNNAIKTSIPSRTPQIATLPPGKIPLTRSKTTSDGFDTSSHHHIHGNHGSSITSSSNNIDRSTIKHNSSDTSLNDASDANPNNNNNNDPRLREFLEYYKARNYSIAAFKEQNPYNIPNTNPKRAVFSVNEPLIEHPEDNDNKASNNEIEKPKRFDAKGRPLPPHPANSKLPSAFKKNSMDIDNNSNDNNSYVSSIDRFKKRLDKFDTSSSTISSASSSSPSSSKKFGAFLKRVTSYGASNDSANEMVSQDSESSISPTHKNPPYPKKQEKFDPSKALAVPGLENEKPLKHVTFAANTYFNDPPQQICSKNPRKGEVEVKPNGAVIIHRLTPQERRKILKESSCGIVVGGSGQLKLLVPEEDIEAPTNNNKNNNNNDSTDSGDSRKSSTDESDPQMRSVKLAAAEAAAEARAQAAPNELCRTVTNNEEEVDVNQSASHFTIDKPMVSRRSSNNLSSSNSLTSLLSHSSQLSDNIDPSEEPIFPPPDLKIPHDIVYTRCCHLREILPIPATLKQLKPGSTDPISSLQLRNPRPSMVEVLSFSDFIGVVPILCITLDGVHLTAEMLRIILSSLVHKTSFEKLSLRNTPLDEEGWKILAQFVSKCKSLSALDLTMVPNIKTNVQKPSKSSLKNILPRMECRMEDRSDMDWDLLTAAIAFRDGIDEIVLAGAKMSLTHFKTFIEVACVNATRLGLAYNELSKQQCVILAQWIVHSKVTGLDIGFNDLQGKLSPFCDALWDKINNKGEKNVFKYLSLNGTNIEVKENDTSDSNEFLKLLSIMCYSENLKYLDLSNNPKIFPYCLPTLVDCLPVFVSLVRLHLDNDKLGRTAMVTLSEALPLCRKLNHISLIGTELDLASCKALTEAVKKSSSLITIDLDWAYVPDNIKEQLSLYAMRNIQTELSRMKDSNKTGKPNFIDGNKESAKDDDTQQLQTIQDELATLLTEDWSHKNRDDYNKMVSEFIKKVTKGREKIQKVVMDLFLIRLQGELNLEGKETLIRLCIIDASLEKGLKLLKQRHYKIASDSASGDSINKNRNHSEKSTSDISLIENRTSVLSSSTFGKSGHSVLLPFGSANIEKTFNNADDTVDFTDETPSELIAPRIKLPNENDLTSDNFTDQDRSTVYAEIPHDITKEQKIALAKAAESMDSDQIKDFLLKSDVNTVIGVIDELHKQGYHFHHIFKNTNQCHDKTIETCNKVDNCNSPVEADGKLSDMIPQDPDKFDKFINTQENEAISAAYDQVLDHLQKIRNKKHPDMSIDIKQSNGSQQ